MDNLVRRLLKASCAFALTAAMAQPTLAQSTRKQLKTANKFFNQENYRASIPYYEQVLAKEPNNAQALFRAGIAYMSFDKEKASDYIYKAQRLKKNVSKDIEYWLGRVDHLNYNFDEAISHFQAYNATLKSKDTRKKELAQLIQHSKNAKVQFNSPKDIFVKNLGPTINTQYSEHSPVISGDDKLLLFTSRGENVTGAGNAEGKKGGNLASDGEYFEDIFEAKRIDDENWEKPRSLSGVLNGKGHDASIQVFDNDTKMLMYRQDENGDFFYTEKSGGDWTAPKKLNGNVNSKAYEGDAYITPDGLTIYFSTAKYSEEGTLDIYYSTRQPGGDWGPAKSIGNAINTVYDDDSPYLSKDGKTLYFSSRGHNTMGGYDIFKSEWDSVGNKWGRPENMGYPVNTPDDDSYYRLSPDGSYAYLSSYRIGGYGEKDIYTINYIKNAIIRGRVLSQRDSTVIPGVELVFSGTQADKTALSYRDVTKPETGDYQVNVLSGRSYQVAVSKDGKNIETQEFAVPISTNDSTVIEKDFYVPYVDTSGTQFAQFKKIYFDTDKYKLRPESITELDNISRILKANPGVNISIEGHCDSRNTDEYNMVLGQNRSDAAYNYLKKSGVSETRMVTVSYGERRPAAANDSPENMQLNRRVEFRVIVKEGEAAPQLTNPSAGGGATGTSTSSSSSSSSATRTTTPLQPGKSKAKLPDGTKVKTKVDEDSDKVKVKTKGANDEKSKTITKDGTIDSKAKEADGSKTKVKTDND
ncbi:outer membrane protein OmpA-like peptidoglycan-associated protein [Hymenobacter luteus]|uniref:Outer membrane protein OmpA-like peptidoglycan-associated protein n=2 Tax=Hymenobacter TaxID=89966 RepID=A0A7W9T0H2_9BACT|nr:MULTISPECIES: OmpA family protein [Hymenobacter]MBB4602244.1 outer membrane protein OmpA-like peptidoglycan-associated protein [Hymenobacter latericoloratus]MBB6059327.1 outer membrane protein OmpA-like peptidoglycan-associated protein [Hymenobacter luteus]